MQTERPKGPSPFQSATKEEEEEREKERAREKGRESSDADTLKTERSAVRLESPKDRNNRKMSYFCLISS